MNALCWLATCNHCDHRIYYWQSIFDSCHSGHQPASITRPRPMTFLQAFTKSLEHGEFHKATTMNQRGLFGRYLHNQGMPGILCNNKSQSNPSEL